MTDSDIDRDPRDPNRFSVHALETPQYRERLKAADVILAVKGRCDFQTTGSGASR